MKKQPWIFTGNTFQRATATSNEKMLVIAKDTDGKLFSQSSDPEINAIYTDYHPVYMAYRAICVEYENATGDRQGQTFDVVTLLKVELVRQLPLWENKIQGVYPVGTPQERAYFPDQRRPFLLGKYDKRIEAVEALAAKLADDPSPVLSAYAATVSSFFVLLDTARNTQVQDKGAASVLAKSRDTQRKNVAKALYTVLARLMFVYHNETEQVASFFDLGLIRSKESTVPDNQIVVKGKVTIEGTDTPVVNARVVLTSVVDPLKPGIEAFTNKSGRYTIIVDPVNPGESGMGRITIDVDGFNTFHYEFLGQAGHVSRVNASLVPAVMLKKVA